MVKSGGEHQAQTLPKLVSRLSDIKDVSLVL